jgi:hypothetical protein
MRNWEAVMDEAELERVRQQFDQLVRERLPGAPVERIEVLQYGDDPEIEPGQLLARVVVATSGDEPDRLRAFEAFHDQHRAAFRDLREELDKLPVRAILQFMAESQQPCDEGQGPMIQMFHTRVVPGPGGGPGPEGPGLTAVMARLGPEDLETLDTLIAAGIATSRAEAVRWALARIRERPAFEQLRARTREIEELKSQF